MTRKGWKAFKRKKIPLLSEKQWKARLRFAKKYANLTAEDWDNFLFTDECPKYLFHYLNPKNDIVWGSQECDVLPAFQVKQSAKVMVWVGMTGRGLTQLHMLPTDQTLRVIFSGYRESEDTREKSIFLLFRQNIPLGELIQGKIV